MTDATVFDLALAQLSLGEYAQIRSEYYITIGSIIREYLYTDKVRITKFRNDYRKAIQEAFYPAFEKGLVDGGGAAPSEGDDLAWITAKAAAEWGYVDSLFQALKELKAAQAEENTAAKTEERKPENLYEGVPEKRAEGYARTLDGVYSEGKIRGAKNQMLTFGGADGQESCKTCQRLKGSGIKRAGGSLKGLYLGSPATLIMNAAATSASIFYSMTKVRFSMSEQEFWTLIRRALLMICSAIEKRYIDKKAN